MKKIKTEQEVIEIAKKARREGKKIVTTNGSFDVFHYGHVKLLKEAKKQGEILIIGVNSDESVRGYKGPERPINPESARLGVLAELTSVDYVFLFDDAIPNRWLELIHPDVHCNSSEYGGNCVEKPILDKLKARLHLVYRDDQDGLSTSNIIKKNSATT